MKFVFLDNAEIVQSTSIHDFENEGRHLEEEEEER